MNIYINGEAKTTHSQQLDQLIVELDLQGKRIAVEMNGELVPKSRHASTALTDDAKIEIIQAVGGG
jgi:sulfur carrier protein